MTFYYFVITLLVASLGAYFGKKIKMPAGIMIGSMVFTGVLNVLTGNVYIPTESRFFVQVVAGGFIGITMDKEKIIQLRTMIKPATVLILGLIVINITLGFLVYNFTSLDLISSLFATVPGGMMDMSIVSYEMGADSARVAMFQVARLIGVIMIFPIIIKYIQDKLVFSEGSKENSSPELDYEEIKNLDSKKYKGGNKEIVLTVIVAFIGGILGKIINIPAGTMVFSLLGVATMKIFTSKGYMYKEFKEVAQIFAGIIISNNITLEVIQSMRAFIIPIIFLVLAYTILCIGLGFLICKIFKIDLITSLFCCTPAGASDMALIASELGAIGPQVALLQVVRLVSVIGIFPSLIQIIVNIAL